MQKQIVIFIGLVTGILLLGMTVGSVEAAYHFSAFKAHPPIHILKSGGKTPKGLSPEKVRAAYHLPAEGGSGTIAII